MQHARGLTPLRASLRAVDGVCPRSCPRLYAPKPLWGDTSLILDHCHLYPYRLFGLVLYIGLSALLLGVMVWENKLGAPEIERQLAALAEQAQAEPTAQPTDDAGAALSPPDDRALPS